VRPWTTECVASFRRGSAIGSLNEAVTTDAAWRLKGTGACYQQTAPNLASWLEDDVLEYLTVLAFPSAHRRTLRNSNALERFNQDINRRTRVATLFPDEASSLLYSVRSATTGKLDDNT